MADANAKALGDGLAQKAFADGLASLFQPVVQNVDKGIQQVLDSQQTLAAQLDALSAELEKFKEIEDGAPSIAEYTAKLAKAKTRLATVQTTINRTRERVANMQRLYPPTCPPPPATLTLSTAQ